LGPPPGGGGWREQGVCSPAGRGWGRAGPGAWGAFVGGAAPPGGAFGGGGTPPPGGAAPRGPGGAPPGAPARLGVAWGGRGPGSAERAAGGADPLDRWSRRVVGGLAAELGAAALYPFGGPPWLPFQRWAKKAEPLHSSPLSVLIHPDWGLWHSYRGALVFAER